MRHAESNWDATEREPQRCPYAARPSGCKRRERGPSPRRLRHPRRREPEMSGEKNRVYSCFVSRQWICFEAKHTPAGSFESIRNANVFEGFMFDLIGTGCYKNSSFRWGRGAVGSAPRWHRGGRGFESHRLHQLSNFPSPYLQESWNGTRAALTREPRPASRTRGSFEKTKRTYRSARSLPQLTMGVAAIFPRAMSSMDASALRRPRLPTSSSIDQPPCGVTTGTAPRSSSKSKSRRACHSAVADATAPSPASNATATASIEIPT